MKKEKLRYQPEQEAQFFWDWLEKEHPLAFQIIWLLILGFYSTNAFFRFIAEDSKSSQQRKPGSKPPPYQSEREESGMSSSSSELFSARLFPS